MAAQNAGACRRLHDICGGLDNKMNNNDDNLEMIEEGGPSHQGIVLKSWWTLEPLIVIIGETSSKLQRLIEFER